VVTNASGTILEDCDYFPYGGSGCSPSSINNYLFTGKERDSESGLDNFGARYDSSQYGRFMSPDDPFSDQEAEDPQTWNLYSFVLNNPLKFVDANGHDHCSGARGDDSDACTANKGTWVIGNEPKQSQTSNQTDRQWGYLKGAGNLGIWALNGNPPFMFHPIRPLQPTNSSQSAGMNQFDLDMQLTMIGELDIAEFGELSGILRDAAAGKGNFGLGEATAQQASDLGKAWVGPNAKVASDGKTLVSADGRRVYRPPTFKPSLGKVQANFEQKAVRGGPPVSNGHLDIK
jgi:RHS repeat-associated protein